MKYFYCFTIVIFLMCTVRAQEQEKENDFSISAQLRSRAEYRNGAIFPRYEGDIPAFFINNRARVSTDYKRSNLSFRMTAQYVGVWGQDPQIDKNGRFILNETWARINLKKGWFTQIGRQSLSYDDERILGNLDWNVAGRYHDALKVGFETGLDKLHVILAFNQNDEEIIGGTYYAPSFSMAGTHLRNRWPIRSIHGNNLRKITLLTPVRCIIDSYCYSLLRNPG